MGWNRLRTYALVAAVALLSTLVVVPAFGADGDDPMDVIEFTAVDGVPRFVRGEASQFLTTAKNGCQINSAETIVDLTGDGGVPGLGDNSIGVKASGPNANGTPCSQVDGAEVLTIQPVAGLLFSHVRLDLEMTGDAVVELTLSDSADNTTTDTFFLQTGTNVTDAQAAEGDFDTNAPFIVTTDPILSEDNPNPDLDKTDACASSTSSGPNSHASDNCIWTVIPGFDFDTIEIEVVNSVGTVSLEGGSDTGAANTTLFHLARLECDEDNLFEGTDEPTYTVRAENGGVECKKYYTYDAGVDQDDPFVELITSSETAVVFLELLELEPQVFPGPAQTPSLYYDDNLGDTNPEKLAPFCLVDPRADLDANVDPEFDLAAPYDSATGAGAVLPTGDTTCIISAEFVTTGADEFGNPLVQATYYLYNLNDGFRTFK